MIAERSLYILLVDDEDIVHITLGDYLRDSGHRIDEARDGIGALNAIESNDYDLALVDVRMPGMDGFDLLEKIQAASPELSVVFITGHGNMEMAIQALRLGAADFLTKPVKLSEIDAVIEKAIRIRDLRMDKKHLRETIKGIQTSEDTRLRKRLMVGASESMNNVREQIKLAAEADCETILLTGETGAGKEVVAREIHFSYGTDDSPFIAVSCPAVPDSLFESELFGHVRGSFTGAATDKAGCFELADGGTLFLDEIADLSLSAQAKLLRVLETRTVRRVGGAREKKVKVRVIAATNAALEKLVKEGAFRRDLFYRLNVFMINLAPLRERREDIIPLAEHFLSIYKNQKGREIKGFSENARDALCNYDYPGNARELRNIVERASILCRSGLIEDSHLNIPIINSIPIPSEDSKQCVSAFPKNTNPDSEKEHRAIIAALDECKWNRREAANKLGIPYSTFRYKLKKFNID